MVEIKRNMGIMSNQVSRLRDEITGKELALAKDQQEHKRLEKNNDILKVPYKSFFKPSTSLWIFRIFSFFPERFVHCVQRSFCPVSR